LTGLKKHMAAGRVRGLAAAGIFALASAFPAGSAFAGPDEAKALLKAMSDYMGSQTAISMAYDTSVEAVTTDGQKIQVAASGMISMNRPDKIRVTRTGGFADIEIVYNGKTFSLLGKGINAYVEAPVEGTITTLVDTLRDKYQKQLPGADLLLDNIYDTLMANVTDVKDLGSGVVGGKECDHLAFRAGEVDWQIWIAQGDKPYPCRYVITSLSYPQQPQYTLDISDWKAGSEVAADDFALKIPDGAKKIDAQNLSEVEGVGDLPSNFNLGGN
jgi:hypothetical protein